MSRLPTPASAQSPQVAHLAQPAQSAQPAASRPTPPIDTSTVQALETLRPRADLARLGAPLCVPAAAVAPGPHALRLASPDAAALLGIAPQAIGAAPVLARLAGQALPAHSVPVRMPRGGPARDTDALLLGEVADPQGQPWMLRLDGAASSLPAAEPPAPLSTASAVRQLLCAEAMQALGLPTARALAVIDCGLDAQGGALLITLAPGFLRFGHFEGLYRSGRHDLLAPLADAVIAQLDPALRSDPQPYAALLHAVTDRTARLVAAWQAIGYCHGAFTPGSLSMLGLCLDHGAGCFLEGFNAHHSPDPQDVDGVQAYAAQPAQGERQCYGLAQAMLPLLGSAQEAQAAVSSYRRVFSDTLEQLLRQKLGLREAARHDRALIDELFALMHAQRVDFTGFFRGLAVLRSGDAQGDEACRRLCTDGAAFDAWAEQYRTRLRQEGEPDAARRERMLCSNPGVVPGASVLAQADEALTHPDGGQQALAALLQRLARPFDPPSPAGLRPS